MKNVIITGGNGMIGKLVLENYLNNPEIGQVTSIVRKPTRLTHPKLVELVHADFTDFTAIDNYLQQQDTCIYCIGVYTGQVSSAEFARITIDYTKAFAGAIKKHNPGIRFCFLSGQGADASEKSRILFARTKGIAENFLLQQQFGGIHIFRPAYIYPVTPRKEPNFMYQLMRVLYKPLLSWIYPNIGLPSTHLAAVMADVGMNGSDKTIFENKDIRKYVMKG
jgi:nucleoside-diphosphate-sugar epimerase